MRAIALVGSRARGTAHAASDLDLVVLTPTPEAFVAQDAWFDGLGLRSLGTRRWGLLVERRLATADDLELDVGFAAPAWAATEPVDPGTARVIAGGGLVALHDPDGLLARLELLHLEQ